MFRTAAWRRHHDGRIYRKWLNKFKTMIIPPGERASMDSNTWNKWIRFGRLRKYSLSCDCEMCRYFREQRKYRTNRAKVKEEELEIIKEEMI
jgi:hypothetical protein